MFEAAILGIIQGIAEWLPVSSEGLIVLAKANLFNATESIDLLINDALLLHLGTLLAAVVYFYRDIILLTKSLLNYKSADSESQKLISFLVITTAISGIIGLSLVRVVTHYSRDFSSSSSLINLIIGCCLLVTACLELKAKKGGRRFIVDIKTSDAILLGIVQGFAALPGLSRSGLTVSALLLRKFDKTQALRISFLMSIPIVLCGNIILNTDQFLVLSGATLIKFFFAFLFGIATIHGLLRVAEKINFGYFVLIFGILTIGSIFT